MIIPQRRNNSKIIPQEDQPPQQNDLSNQLANTIRDRYRDLIQDEDECKAKLTQRSYASVKQGYRYKQYQALFLILLILGLFSYFFIQDWINLDDNDKYIGDSKCPWGVLYILFTLPIIIIQKAHYNSLPYKEKELQVLINDYRYMQLQDRNMPNLDVNHTDCDLQPFIDNILAAFLLLFQFCTPGRGNMVFQLVGLQFLGEFYQNIQRIASYELLKFQTIYESQNNQYLADDYKEFSGIWNFKLEEGNYENFYVKVYHSIMNELIKRSDEIMHTDGNQLSLLFSSLYRNTYLFAKLKFLLLTAGIFGFSLQQQSIYENSQSDQFFNFQFFPLLILSVYQFLYDMLIEPTIYGYFKHLETLEFIKSKGNMNDKQIQHKDINAEMIGVIFNQQYFFQFFILIIQLICMKFSSTSDGFFNIFALNYILRIDLIGINNYYYTWDKTYLRQKTQRSWFKYPEVLNHKTADQYICYVLQLEVDIEQLGRQQMSDKQLQDKIYDKLKKLQEKLKYEDSFQIQIVERNLAFIVRILILILTMGYCAIILEEKIGQWDGKSSQDKFAGNSFPWGAIYIFISLPILYIQGIGNSEDSQIFKQYMGLRKQYFYLKQRTNSQRNFEWSDYDDIYCQINRFNTIQAWILGVVLLVIQYFSIYFYEMLQNLVALEFLYYLDEHALGSLSRYLYKYEKLQNRWRSVTIPRSQGQNFRISKVSINIYGRLNEIYQIKKIIIIVLQKYFSQRHYQLPILKQIVKSQKQKHMYILFHIIDVISWIFFLANEQILIKNLQALLYQ